MIATPRKPSRSRSSPVTHCRRERRGPVVERRIDRGRQHDGVDAGVDEAGERRQVGAAQRLQRRVDPLGGVVGVDRGRAEAGEVLGGRAHAAAAQAGGEGARAAGHGAWRAAVRAPLARQRGARAPDVGDRREIHVHPGGAQRARGALAVGARLRGGADVGRGAGRRAGDAPHRPALLVGHHDERCAQAGRAADRLQAAHRRAQLAGRADVAREDDHAGRLPAGDPAAQGGRRGQARRRRRSCAGRPPGEASAACAAAEARTELCDGGGASSAPIASRAATRRLSTPACAG